MNMLRKIILIPIGFLFILTIISTNVSAEVKGNENMEFIGGWSEDSGYWNTFDQLKASNKPQKHWAKITRKSAGGVVYTKVTGYTEWKGVKHYTRARFEGLFGVEGDSGRIYGYGKTQASSDWVDKFFTVAKTYWGK